RPRLQRAVSPRDQVSEVASRQGAAAVHDGPDAMSERGSKMAEKAERTSKRTKRPAASAGARKRAKAATPPAAKRRLVDYRKKRDFTRTEEPRGGPRKAGRKQAYVIQKHA